jgi:putative ABC transport system ATP-binding protein
MTPEVPVIELNHLSKVYKMGDTEVWALRQVDLKIYTGEFVAVMGPSGSGKSTLMNIVGCLDRPTEGQYFLEGEDVSGLTSDQRANIRNDRVGFVFQSFNLLARTSALENVELPLLYSSKLQMTDEERDKRARICLEKVGLAGREAHTSAQLSGGQQQRVAIARALINDPAIVLADEPTGNLDSATSEEIMTMLEDLNAEGRTIVLITHDMDIARHAKRITTFRDGQIISDSAMAMAGPVAGNI